MSPKYLPVDISQIGESDIPYIEKDLDIRRVSAGVRTLVDYWFAAQNNPNNLDSNTLQIPYLDKAGAEILVAMRKMQRFSQVGGGYHCASLKGKAVDMAFLLQALNFVFTLRDVLAFNADTQSGSLNSGSKPQSHLFAGSNAGFHLPRRYVDIYQSTGKITDVYKAAGNSGTDNHQTIYDLDLDFRKVYEKILYGKSKKVQRELQITNNKNALQESRLSIARYSIQHPAHLSPTKYDITYHPGAEEAIRAGVNKALNQEGSADDLIH